MSLIKKVVEKTGMELGVVQNVVQLLDEGNTIPFIARYRKELTKGATDEQLRDFNDIYEYTKNLEKRKEDVIRLIDEKGLLTPELKKEIEAAETLSRVEDLYRPFKEKKNTKATIAKAKGLEPLAIILKKAELTKEEFEEKAKDFIRESKKKEEIVKTKEEAIQGAKDIVAEDVSDHADLREEIKIYIELEVVFCSKATKDFEENGVYKIYADYSKKLSEIPSYAYLALSRAEKEKQLKLKFLHNVTKYFVFTTKYFVPSQANTSKIYLEEAIQDGLDRLLIPSLEREVRSNKKKWSDEAAIKVFGENMKNLLLGAPVKGKVVMGFDPAYRTGCKIAIVDETGKFLANTVIYPTPPQSDIEKSEYQLLKMINDYKVSLIVIGNGTASRESERFVGEFLKKYKLTNVEYTIVSEAGASVYSASKLAQEEYPKLDVTVRGAISIAHRLQDPLAELTKIDPKSIGVGQYQHDVDQKLLQQKLDEKVEDTVNAVGVDVNTASYALLQYVAGLSKAMAQNIVSFRDEKGAYTKKNQIKKAKGLGPKAYEQCIGFLRIKEGNEVLDCTGIHPENHKITYDILKNEYSVESKKLSLPLELESKNVSDLSEKYGIGVETLTDIFKELARPGLDPRDNIPAPQFKSDVLEVKDLEIGMTLDGVIRNVTDFGAFVDIGLHNDGLVHKSQIADSFVSNPIDVVSVGQAVKVKVLSIDVENEKVGLSMKGLNGSVSTTKKKTYSPKASETISNKSEIKGSISFS